MKHTEGPWKVENGNMIRNGEGHSLAYVVNHKSIFSPRPAVPATMQEVDANARLIAAAVNSYAKHCGERAVECAESDLLGDLLDALREIITLAEARDMRKVAKAAIAKATK